MLQLTSNATRHLVKLRQERGLDDRAGVRFVSKEGRVGVTFSLNPANGDREIDAETIKVYVAPEIASTLEQSVIDTREEDGKASLVLRKQAAAAPKVASSAN